MVVIRVGGGNSARGWRGMHRCYSLSGNARRARPSRPVRKTGLTGEGLRGLFAAPSRPERVPSMHAYRTHTCGALRATDAGADRPPLRLGAQQARPWRAAVHRSARPLRHDAMRVRRPARRRSRRPMRLRPESVITVTGEVVLREGGDGEPEAADRRDRAAGGRRWRCSRPPRCCRCRSPATSNSPRTCG